MGGDAAFARKYKPTLGNSECLECPQESMFTPMGANSIDDCACSRYEHDALLHAPELEAIRGYYYKEDGDSGKCLSCTSPSLEGIWCPGGFLNWTVVLDGQPNSLPVYA
jgi:hypothetical protein